VFLNNGPLDLCVRKELGVNLSRVISDVCHRPKARAGYSQSQGQREGTFEFLDNYNNKRTGNQRLFPVAAFVGGKAAPQRA
jgi:hypothetical protein